MKYLDEVDIHLLEYKALMVLNVVCLLIFLYRCFNGRTLHENEDTFKVQCTSVLQLYWLGKGAAIWRFDEVRMKPLTPIVYGSLFSPTVYMLGIITVPVSLARIWNKCIFNANSLKTVTRPICVIIYYLSKYAKSWYLKMLHILTFVGEWEWGERWGLCEFMYDLFIVYCARTHCKLDKYAGTNSRLWL